VRDGVRELRRQGRRRPDEVVRACDQGSHRAPPIRDLPVASNWPSGHSMYLAWFPIRVVCIAYRPMLWVISQVYAVRLTPFPPLLLFYFQINVLVFL